MDRSANTIVIALCILLTSCGQVGTITGGPVDNEAPKPILSELTPPQASLNTSPNKIEVPFNEYIKLNNPSENIKVVPNDVNLDHSIQGKTLVLELKDGMWKENTTYSIYLNRAVQDITENNDSIMLYVFSTGPTIDSLKATLSTKDAYSGNPLDDVTIGLFEQDLSSDTSDQRPRYFSSTDKNGLADFKYLKDGSYYVYAFVDENKNNQLDAEEKRGKMHKKLRPSFKDTIVDTITVMPAEQKTLRILSNEFTSPGVWCIGLNKPFPNNYTLSFFQDGFVDSSWNSEKDSLTIFLESSLSGSKSFIINGDSSIDTITKRYFFKERPPLSATNNLMKNNLLFGDTLELIWNDGLKSLDTSSVHCSHVVDSTVVYLSPRYTILKNNKLRIYNLKAGLKDISLSFLPKSVVGYNLVLEDSLSIKFNTGSEKDVGTLIVTLDTIPSNAILMLRTITGQEVARKRLNENLKITFKHLPPGKYMYSILIDDNSNGIWDTGDVFSNRSPERVIWIPQTSTVRANWEVESSIDLSSKFK